MVVVRRRTPLAVVEGLGGDGTEGGGRAGHGGEVDAEGEGEGGLWVGVAGGGVGAGRGDGGGAEGEVTLLEGWGGARA